MKKLLLFLIVGIILSVSFISAQQEDIRFYHQIETNLTIYEKCRINGAICGSEFNCNATVLSPAQELIIDNENMTRGNVYHNITLNPSQTNTNGIYETTIDCTNSSSSGSNTFFYQITPNGSKPMETSQGIIAFVSILMITLIAGICFSLSYKINNGWVSLSFLSFAIILLVFAFGMVLNILELSFGTFSTIIGNYSALYITFIALVSVGVTGLIIWLIVFVLNQYWISRGMIDKVGFRD